MDIKEFDWAAIPGDEQSKDKFPSSPVGVEWRGRSEREASEER